MQNCYRSEIEQIIKRPLSNLDLTGSELSTLNISNNRAQVRAAWGVNDLHPSSTLTR